MTILMSCDMGTAQFVSNTPSALVSTNTLTTQRASINTPAITTNVLAFYLADEGLAQPVLSDADFIAWDVTSNTFLIRPQAALRLYNRCGNRIVPFVLMACGEPTYRGYFETSLSSSAISAPSIITDFIPFEVRMSPDDDRKMSDAYAKEFSTTTNIAEVLNNRANEPGLLMTQIMATTTNATNNVMLTIDAGYPPPYGLGPAGSIDRRNDKRVAAAVERLLGKSKR